MKRVLFNLIMLSMIIFESCEFEKSYKYIEIISEKRFFGIYDNIKETEPETIMAVSDSAAYLEAYEKFCISRKVYNDAKEVFGGTFSTPLKFKLLNKEGNDITNSVFFEDKEELEKEIENRIFSMSNSLK